jgi:hypothetical protein
MRRFLLERALPAFVLTLAAIVVLLVLASFVLAYCTPEKLVPAPSASPTPSASLAPVAGPPVPPPPSPAQGVNPGALCATAGRLGYTVAGTLMRCSATEQDHRLRWRRA